MSTYANFLEDCLNPSLSSEKRFTVNVIIDQLGVSGCQKAYDRLVSISRLNLSASGIIDISPLNNLTKITELNLSENEIENIEILSSLKNLVSLNLSQNFIKDITPLSGLQNITILNLSDNQLDSISPLENITSLTSLDISFQDSGNIFDYSTLEVIKNLINLKIFKAIALKINNINFLIANQKIKSLYLGYNLLKDISPLQFLITLENINLVSNKITNVSPLQGLIHMTILDLYNNPIIKDEINCPYQNIPSTSLSNYCKWYLGEHLLSF